MTAREPLLTIRNLHVRAGDREILEECQVHVGVPGALDDVAAGVVELKPVVVVVIGRIS